jgi:hypothetical protein
MPQYHCSLESEPSCGVDGELVSRCCKWWYMMLPSVGGATGALPGKGNMLPRKVIGATSVDDSATISRGGASINHWWEVVLQGASDGATSR